MPPSPPAAPLLSVEGLHVRFSTPDRVVDAVRGVSFRVERGETVALVGESGSGKSVSSLAVLRLVEHGGGRIVGGSIRFRRRDGAELDLARTDRATLRAIRGGEIAMVFQEPMTSLDPVFTAGEQIAEAIRLHQGLDRARARAEALRMLDLVRIPDAARVLDRHPHQLSGGMRQRVMIAMALSCRPGLLILDEPTTALDVTVQARILALVRALQDELHMGVLFVTHDMAVVAEIADRVVVLRRGEKVEEGAAERIFAAPEHPYTRALLAAVPRLGAMAGTDGPARFSVPVAVAPPLPSPSPPAGERGEAGTLAPGGESNEAWTPASGGESGEAWTPASGGERGPSSPAPGESGESGGRTSSPLAPGASRGRGEGERGPSSPAPGERGETSTGGRMSSPLAPGASRGRGGGERGPSSPAPGEPGGAPRPAVTPAPAPPVLEVRDLTARFDLPSGVLGRVTRRVHAVERVSFDLRAGETLALVGESGCGKSTTARALLRLVDVHAGSVRLGGRELVGLPLREVRPLRREIQMVFQDPFASLDPRLTVGFSIAEPLLVHGAASRREADARVAALLADVGLPADHARRYPHELSGGQRQRVCVARALALRPKVIVADEAVSSLDATVRAQVLDLLVDLQERLGTAFLFISHDLAVVERVSHRVAVMYLGRIVELGPRRAIFEDPRHPYTQKLLAAVPVADPARRHLPRAAIVAEELPSPIRAVGDDPPPLPLVEVAPGHLVAPSPTLAA